MARCLTEALIKYQTAEEAKILSIADELDEPSKSLVRELYEPLKITSEDLSREYSDSDEMKLCLRTKVRVNMTLFNCVWDAKRRLDKKGRLVNRSERFINAMLVKAVTKKMVLPYTEEEIEKCNYIRRCQLKKENNRRLNRWNLESTQEAVLDCSHLSPSLLPAQVTNQSQSNSQQQSVELQLMKFPATLDSQNTESTLGILTNGPEMWVIEESPAAENISASEMVESLSMPDLGPDTDWVHAAAQINTESMTIGTLEFDLPTDSQPIISNSENYDNFNTQVPATSTQTQPQPQSQCTEPFL
ncbi:PREDICTED: telomere-binding protein cav [Drosophila arizonae]|uniref:Telomere-binding protein cav n=1 Tax=Drosophila arizonae TaxID=7263 RepID=A0ABM1NNM2_DROAR|nr:PREDICTED: telomere-binding protein cav [Drosophila arizonae]